MSISVEIDKQSGFCGGVIRAINKAESFLNHDVNRKLYSLGAIVHNEAEMQILKEKGLVTIDRDEFEGLHNVEGENLLIRAHGEPPETYEHAQKLGFNIIDCTCPVVLQLQKHIRDAYERLHSDGKKGQIIIFGKVGHAEVIGLVKQVPDDTIVVENQEMLNGYLDEGKILLDGPIEVFSQTTKSPAEYSDICAILEEKMAKHHELSVERFKGTGLLQIHNTICAQVASRHAELSDFAMNHDIIIFVSGKDSSNGRVLCELCKSLNIRTYHIGSVEEIRKEWFRDDDRVGVCGATSTPKWLLENVASSILNIK
jgi:4-hydroxy-3-methylbut-2-enyl diphosphate reductase